MCGLKSDRKGNCVKYKYINCIKLFFMDSICGIKIHDNSNQKVENIYT